MTEIDWLSVRPKERQHQICTDCHVRLKNLHRGVKHEVKTGHVVTVNIRAERAHIKYIARQQGGFLSRLDARDNALYGRGWE